MQGVVGFLNNNFIVNLLQNLPVKKLIKIGYDLTELWP